MPNTDEGRGDAGPGLTLQATRDGLDETDPAALQRWGSEVTAPTSITGAVTLTLASAMQDFDASARGRIEVWLLRCDALAGPCVELATDDVKEQPWATSGSAATDPPDGWRLHTFDLTPATLPVPLEPGDLLVLRVQRREDGQTPMWLAYDHTSYPSALEFGATPVGASVGSSTTALAVLLSTASAGARGFAGRRVSRIARVRRPRRAGP